MEHKEGREEGYYWVKYQDEWEISYYYPGYESPYKWLFGELMKETDLSDIDENRIERTPTIRGNDVLRVILK